ncbi:MAG: FAD-dependent oxidoreductase [bacterium]
MARCDLTVRGGGIFGLSIAWEAARRGARVRLIETVAIGAGSSGGLVGALAPHVPENWNDKKQFQLESLLMAEAFLTTASAASGLPTGYARTGRLQPIADAAALTLAQTRARAAASLWGNHAQWQVIPTTGGAWQPASPTGHLIHDSLSALIHPRLTLLALAEAIRTTGGEVLIGNADDHGPTVHATGTAGLQDLSAAMGHKVGDGVKGQAILLQHNAATMPQLFTDTLHVIPHLNGTVAIGSTSERDWAHPTSTDAQLDALLTRARAALPVLQDAPVIERWAALRPRAQSRAPLLGPWPGRPGHYVANGGFKIGFGMAPNVAKVMVDLVLTGIDAIPAGFNTAAL